jgi:carboxyl-terminal processing protease
VIERFNRGELMHADSIHFPDSLRVRTKKLGRTVYGGGGIMPDYFVPMDTTLYSNYHRDLVAKGVITKFTMSYIEAHRKELTTRYKKFNVFNEKFDIDDSMLATLRQIGEKEGVKFDEKGYTTALPLIKTQLKALIARDLWDMSEYFQVINTTNRSVQKALEILNGKGYPL